MCGCGGGGGGWSGVHVSAERQKQKQAVIKAHTAKCFANPGVNERGSLQHFFYALLIPGGGINPVLS